MITCPLCDFENIEGVDVCDQCGQPLDDAHLPSPKNAVERGLLIDTVDTLYPRQPITVAPDTTVRDVLELLVKERIGSVFVVENGRTVGVFSERDALLRLNTAVHELGDEPIRRFMTPNPAALRPHTRLAFAIHQMDVGGYRHLPIIDDADLATGVISVRDILRYLAEKATSAS